MLLEYIVINAYFVCVHSGLAVQGILSRAVCWEVLEEQLFTSKVGGDEKRRELFQTILHLDRENAHEERLYSPSYVATQKHPLLGEDALNRASFHTHSWQLDKQEERHLSETRLNFLSRAWPIHKNRTNRSSGSRLYWETVEVMRCVLDVGTHLTRFPTPLAPQNAIFIAAKDDLYVPRKHIADVRSAWPGKINSSLGLGVGDGSRDHGCVRSAHLVLFYRL